MNEPNKRNTMFWTGIVITFVAFAAIVSLASQLVNNQLVTREWLWFPAALLFAAIIIFIASRQDIMIVGNPVAERQMQAMVVGVVNGLLIPLTKVGFEKAFYGFMTRYQTQLHLTPEAVQAIWEYAISGFLVTLLVVTAMCLMVAASGTLAKFTMSK